MLPYIPPLQRFFKSRGRATRMKALALQPPRRPRLRVARAYWRVPPLAESAEDIRDIRGPKAVPGSWMLPAVLAGAIVVALCAYAFWRRRRRGDRRRSSDACRNRPCERLENTRPLMRPATAREFGIAASEAIRRLHREALRRRRDAADHRGIPAGSAAELE